MFTIEHRFDGTVITLIDEGRAQLREDVTVIAHDEGVTLEQYDAERDEVLTITLSLRQVQELRAALDLPEGVYRLALPEG